MYAYIKGSLEQKTNTFVIIENNGIGYKIFMPPKSIDGLGEIGEVIKVYTYYYVREDNISLYGFSSNEELRMFELLISVSGIGAKSAIVTLSEISPSSFAIAVVSDDITKLTKIPGIGKKTAARIVLELKDKLKAEENLVEEEKQETVINNSSKNDEAIAALQVLGYTKKEIENVLANIDGTLELEETIKQALKYLSRN